MPTKAEGHASRFLKAGNVAEFQRGLATECEEYTQCEFTFDDGSVLVFGSAHDELIVETFGSLGDLEAAKPERPERPRPRKGLKRTKGKEVLLDKKPKRPKKTKKVKK